MLNWKSSVISKAPVSLWYINMNNYEIMFVFIADMLEKNERKLREENDMLKRENIVLKQKCISQDEIKKMMGELQKQNSYLEKRQSCKICSENELEIMLIPCRHVYCCKECFDKQQKKWCNICNQNVQRVDSFHLP